MQRSLKKGMWYASAPGKTAREKFQAVKAAGFDGIEPPSHLDQDEVLRARDETGLPSLVSVAASTRASCQTLTPQNAPRGWKVSGKRCATPNATAPPPSWSCRAV